MPCARTCGGCPGRWSERARRGAVADRNSCRTRCASIVSKSPPAHLVAGFWLARVRILGRQKGVWKCRENFLYSLKSGLGVGATRRTAVIETRRQRRSPSQGRSSSPPRTVGPGGCETSAYGVRNPISRTVSRTVSVDFRPSGTVSHRALADCGSRRLEQTATKKPSICWAFMSGETQTRTGDTTIFSRVLYQLSYPAVTGAKR